MEDSADISRSAGSDSSRSGFKLNAKLEARMEKLSRWRIDPSLIRFSEDSRGFRGGNGTVSKAFLSSGSDERFREAADRRQDDQGEGGDEEKDGEHEHEPNAENEKCVAVKKPLIAEEEDLERALGLALRETELLAELVHPNIVKLEGFVEDVSSEIIWLVFPWADNGNLKDFVASRDWQIPERVFLIDNVAQGLEYLHSQKPPICHGDLKSLNVLVNSRKLAVITDFGSARRLTEHDPKRQMEQVQNQPQSFQASFDASSNTITLTGNMYTLRWAAPELLHDGQKGLWSDMWAFGWIVYEVMTGFIPFKDVPEIAVINRVIEGDLPSITDNARTKLLLRLSSLMIMCWNIKPSERPTAEYCRKAMDWIPKIIPDARRRSESMASGIHSPELLGQLGGMYYLHCDYANARNSYTEALQICTDLGDEGGRGDALRGLAHVHFAQTEYSEAFTLRSEVLEIRTNLGDGRGRAEALSGLAQVHGVRCEYREAIDLYSKALQIHTDMNDKKRSASALRDLAGVHKDREDYDEAIVLYSKALQICIDIGDRNERAFALLGLAEVNWVRNEYDKAILLYSELLQIYTDTGDRNSRATVISRLADTHSVRKEHSEAIARYSEAVQLHTDLGDRQGRAYALLGLAAVHVDRNEYSEAIPLYSEALQIFTDLGQGRCRADALRGLARVHQFRNENDKATALYSEALQAYTDTGEKKLSALVLLSLGDVHRDRNEYSEAIALFSEALQINTDIGDSLGRAGALAHLARVHWAQDHYNDAASLFQEAAEIFGQIGQSDVAATTKKAADMTLQLALRSHKAT